MKKRLVTTAVMLGLALTAGAQSRSSASAEQASVAEAMKRYTAALAAGPAGVPALVGSFASDGELLEPGMPALKGPDAIREFLEVVGSAVKVTAATATSDSIDVRGDAAYQWGEYSQTVEALGQPAAVYRGRYVAQWVKGAAGWKLRRLLVQPFPLQ